MKLLAQWIPIHCIPPRWMAFSHYSAERNQLLFVAFPLNFAVSLAWWIQCKWAIYACSPSWIENEIRRRVKLERSLERVSQ
jgi:hypothetical protein